jgi:hypothetical protein
MDFLQLLDEITFLLSIQNRIIIQTIPSPLDCLHTALKGHLTHLKEWKHGIATPQRLNGLALMYIHYSW